MRTLAIVAFLIMGVRIVDACTCIQPPHRDEFRKAAAVFAGEVIEVKEDSAYKPPKLFPSPHLQKLVDSTRKFTARFKILQNFKGAAGKEFSVNFYTSESSCSGLAFGVE